MKNSYEKLEIDIDSTENSDELQRASKKVKSSLQNSVSLALSNIRTGFTSLESCPKELYVNFVLKYCESYGYFALSQILVIYLHNEFGTTDIEGGMVYGIWGICITFWGLLTSFINDNLGVRKSLLIGFTISFFSSMIIAFTTSKFVLYFTLFCIFPIGTSMGIPMLTVGIKRYTTVINRGFAFGLYYSVMNIAAFVSGPVVDLFNITFSGGLQFGSVKLSGNRLVILTTTVTYAFSLFVTYNYLREIKVTEQDTMSQLELGSDTTECETDKDIKCEVNESDENGCVDADRDRSCSSDRLVVGSNRKSERNHVNKHYNSQHPHGDYSTVENEEEEYVQHVVDVDMESSSNPMIGLGYDSGVRYGDIVESEGCSGGGFDAMGVVSVVNRPVSRISSADRIAESAGNSSGNNNDTSTSSKEPSITIETYTPESKSLYNTTVTLLYSPTFWRFTMLTLFLINLRTIFRHLDATLPTYLIRCFGPNYPKGMIYSINPFMIIWLTPVVAALTTTSAHFDMIKYGGYISAVSPLFMACSTSTWAVVLFVVLLSLGEAVWSPRIYDYTMTIAPEGREASFSALAAAPLFAAKVPVGLMSGFLLAKYIPEGGAHPDGQTLWLIIGLLTLSSPILITIFESCIREPTPEKHKK